MEKDLQKALEVLKNGGVILYPTDTIWGIGCDATNDEAVSKIFKIKNREADKSLLVLVDSFEKIYDYVSEVPAISREVALKSVKPLTVIYPGGKNLSEKAMADDGTIGIRVTTELFSHKLVKEFGKPIISTSANFSGEPSPANFKDVTDRLKEEVDYVVEYRQNEEVSKEGSGIIKFTE